MRRVIRIEVNLGVVGPSAKYESPSDLLLFEAIPNSPEGMSQNNYFRVFQEGGCL